MKNRSCGAMKLPRPAHSLLELRFDRDVHRPHPPDSIPVAPDGSTPRPDTTAGSAPGQSVRCSSPAAPPPSAALGGGKLLQGSGDGPNWSKTLYFIIAKTSSI